MLRTRCRKTDYCSKHSNYKKRAYAYTIFVTRNSAVSVVEAPIHEKTDKEFDNDIIRWYFRKRQQW
ncbi:MAG: hypothetical protein JNM36_11265 [Chitinophagales bacterium]|nr:hypothetical protein [Chitinophagales bacterium]